MYIGSNIHKHSKTMTVEASTMIWGELDGESFL